MRNPGFTASTEPSRVRHISRESLSNHRSVVTFNSLWIGGRLGALERACLRSFLSHGHHIRLWCYSEPESVPAGVELEDAAKIFPPCEIIRYRTTGSVSLFSNRFRYELLRRGLGTWVDTDVYLLKPMPALPEHVFAWEAPDRIGTAVLRLPADSPILASLLDLFLDRTVPRWIPWRYRLKAYARLWSTGRSGLAQMPWGTAGPRALTYLCQKSGIDRAALGSDVFYPVHWSRADWIVDPSICVDEVITERTVAIHLWNSLIEEWKDEPAPSGTFLARLQREGSAEGLPGDRLPEVKRAARAY